MKQKMALTIYLSLTVFYWSCKQKKNDVFPVIDFIKAQVASVDTSLNTIMKLVPKTDSTYDTTYVKREQFKDLARDFLETPDISKKFSGKYTEERMMNNELGLAVFIATPKDEDLEVRRQEVRIEPQEVTIEPNPPNDKIKSVYIERVKNSKDSSVTKRMTWYVDKKFQVVTITQKPNQAEETSVVEVVWNPENNE